MLIAGYIVVAALVVWLSIKASQYVDMIDRTTKLSGAFLGGVLLSAVTSLPELFTSISATVLLDQPGLCIGNILGSDLFNSLILAVAALVFFRSFRTARIDRSHYFVIGYVLAIYLLIGLNCLDILRVNVWSVSLTSVAIVVLYVLGIRHLSGESEESFEEQREVKLSTTQITLRFVATCIGIVGLSILMTYLTSDLAERYNIGEGLAGALFLGIATSLPELSSTATLFKIKNYNIAVGNIVGSNLFNFIILAIADLCTLRTVYDFSDPKTVNLLIFGAVASLVMIPLLRIKRSWGKLVFSLAIIGSYLAFLIF